jgi:four helix bundle protein
VATFLAESDNGFRKLLVWKEAHKLTLKIYKATNIFPDREKFGITDQLRRASSSIGANIAEGSGRYTPKDQLHFYTFARGSLAEVDNFVELAHDLQFVTKEIYEDLRKDIQNLKGLLARLIKQRSSISRS